MTHPHRFPYLINDAEATTSDASPTPEQILTDAGFEPADDFTLIQRTAHGTDVTNSEDTFDLSQGPKEFFAFPSGRVFELRINTHSIFWGEPNIGIAKLRDLGHVAATDDLLWEHGTEVTTLALTGSFSLNGDGIEHLRTHHRQQPPHEYEYFVDGKRYTTTQRELSGAQIMALIPGWNPENSLILEGQGAEADEIVHATTVVVFEGREHAARFAIVPPATFGGHA
jgi:hypothetical protein